MVKTIHIRDQIGTQIILPKVPERVISLVPSLTYTMYRLQLEDKLVGVTRFCKYPLHITKQKTIIGGTKDVKFDRIKQLKPDLILANKEENTKEIVDFIKTIAPVYVSDVFDINSNMKMLNDFGDIFNIQNSVIEIKNNINHNLTKLNSQGKLSAVYLIWKNPWMSIGGDTFISKMMQYAGFDNLFNYEKRYPEISINTLVELKPQILLLSSEPYPFKEKDRSELQKLLPDTCILLVKGEPFTWFGTYIETAVDYFKIVQKEIKQCIQNKKN